MGITRDRCAISALQIALKRLGPPLSVVVDGNVTLTPRGQDIEYIRMVLQLYDKVRDEHGELLVSSPTA